MPDKLPLLADLHPLLRTARFGRTVRGFGATGSTNAEAVRWGERGAPEGALVVAEHQTAGRGRLGRAWADARGQNLLLSLVLRPAPEALRVERLGLIPLMAGVAVAEAVAPFVAPVEPALKWPNDVLLEGRKTAGLLLETRLGGVPLVVLGVGLNVNQVDFPPPLADRATSLRLATGRTVPRADLLARLLARLEARYDELLRDGGAATRGAFTQRMVGLGERAAVGPAGGGAERVGTLEGIGADGALLLQAGGGLRRLHAGEVTLRGRAPHELPADLPLR